MGGQQIAAQCVVLVLARLLSMPVRQSLPVAVNFSVTYHCGGYTWEIPCPQLNDGDYTTCCSPPYHPSTMCDVRITLTSPTVGDRVEITSRPLVDHLDIGAPGGWHLTRIPNSTIEKTAVFQLDRALLSSFDFNAGRLCELDIFDTESGLESKNLGPNMPKSSTPIMKNNHHECTSPATSTADAARHPPPDAWEDFTIAVLSCSVLVLLAIIFGSRQKLQSLRCRCIGPICSCLRGLISRLCSACGVRKDILQKNTRSTVTLDNGAAVEKSTGAPEKHGDGDATEERNGRHDARDTVELSPLMTTDDNRETV